MMNLLSFAKTQSPYRTRRLSNAVLEWPIRMAGGQTQSHRGQRLRLLRRKRGPDSQIRPSYFSHEFQAGFRSPFSFYEMAPIPASRHGLGRWSTGSHSHQPGHDQFSLRSEPDFHGVG